MKHYMVSAAAAVFALASCESMNRPIDTGNFDPLSPPGAGDTRLAMAGPGFKTGGFVSAVMDNTAFFNKRPQGDADADKLLSRGTSMKVISADNSYVRVELDSGEVGWVPTVMVEDPNAAPAIGGGFEATNPNEIQIYPPMPGFGDTTVPPLPADPPPEGTIPTVIEPESPNGQDGGSVPLPDVPGSTALPDVAPAD
jgi:hypothetical protein